MDDMFSKKHHRKVQEPQLAAMVDVFSLLIVFLVLGTVFNSATVVMPEGLILPTSSSKEILDVTFQVIVQENEVDFNFLDRKLKADIFSDSKLASQTLGLREEIKAFLSKQDKTQQKILNLVAHDAAPYKTVFDVVKFCQESGFQSVSFVTMGKN